MVRQNRTGVASVTVRDIYRGKIIAIAQREMPDPAEGTCPVELIIQPEILERFPGLTIMAAVAEGIDNRLARPDVDAFWVAAWEGAHQAANQYESAQAHPRVAEERLRVGDPDPLEAVRFRRRGKLCKLDGRRGWEDPEVERGADQPIL